MVKAVPQRHGRPSRRVIRLMITHTAYPNKIKLIHSIPFFTFKPWWWMKGPLRGTSGFRCEDYNQMVSTTGINGPHNQSRVAEILVSGEWGNVVIRKSLSDRFQRDRVKPKGCHTYTDSDQFSSYHKKLINPSFSSHYLPPTYQQVSSSVSKVLHIMLFED